VPTNLNLLIVRTVGDEASAALAASRFVAWLYGRLWFVLSLILSPLAMIHRALGRVARWMPDTLVLASALLLPIFVAGTLIMDSLLGAPSSTPLHISVLDSLRQSLRSGIADPTILNVLDMLLVVAVILGAFLAIGILALWPIFVGVGIVLLPVFGAEAALTAMAWEISEEPVPNGSWTIHQYSSESYGTLLDLAHGLSYEDERVHQRLASWIATIPTAEELASPRPAQANPSTESDQAHAGVRGHTTAVN
jgi:hypothetical protein